MNIAMADVAAMMAVALSFSPAKNKRIAHTKPMQKTINALVIDLTAGVMHLAWGNPCQNPYHTYHLDI